MGDQRGNKKSEGNEKRRGCDIKQTKKLKTNTL